MSENATGEPHPGDPALNALSVHLDLSMTPVVHARMVILADRLGVDLGGVFAVSLELLTRAVDAAERGEHTISVRFSGDEQSGREEP
jgi:hypothetical protein